jgi:flagellar hook-basal body complex protein FliE
MSLPIAPVTIPSAPQLIPSGSAPSSGDSTFKDALHSAVQNVESARSAADAAAQNFVSGGNGELHSTILAAQSSELDFELFMQVRNKVVAAYEDIMKMQV